MDKTWKLNGRNKNLPYEKTKLRTESSQFLQTEDNLGEEVN